MASIVAVEHITLDGVMQAPARADEDTRDGFEHGGWGASRSDPLMQQVIGARMGAAWSLLVGRRTYEDFAKVWPNRPKPNPMGEALTRVQKFVASTTLTEPLPWENSTLLKGDATDAIGRLKRERDETLVVFGSGALLRSLMPHGLIDEYVLQIHPVVLGKGRRLFPDDGASMRLSLVESVTTPTGVIIATYRTSASGT
jgi:dihydrofolate reductase